MKQLKMDGTGMRWKFKLKTNSIPENIKTKLPSIEELENGLTKRTEQKGDNKV